MIEGDDLKSYKIKRVIIFVCCIYLILLYTQKLAHTNAEQYDILAGSGIDIIKNVGGDYLFDAQLSIYNFKGNEKAYVKNGIAYTIGGTRENRQLKNNKAFLFGSQKVLILQEDFARHGIQSEVNILFANPQINDRSKVVISKDPSGEVLKLNIKEYNSSADFLDGMIENSSKYTFDSNEYNLINVYASTDTEGRRLLLPYIEIENGKLRLTGLALFKGFYMVTKLNVEESKIVNLLRANGIKAMYSLKQEGNKSIMIYTTSHRKVRCDKVNGKYVYNIELNMTGNVLGDSVDKSIDAKAMAKIENQLSEKIKRECNSVIKKAQNIYKVDSMELSKYAISKYGRDTGVDWDKIFTESDINVDVKFKIDKIGRGTY